MFRPRISSLARFKRAVHQFKISDEVKDALSTGKPVVSLESTIITHGLPYPQNLEMARSVESKIREHGAIPATIAFMDGTPKVGIESWEIERLANAAGSGNINKVSRRDMAYTMANKLLGGTTISSTMILSQLAGIKVFATGGLGGVHRGAEVTMDVSADLEELGRTPVAVVCAGPKAILDIEKTMEYLETKGCLVATMGTPGSNVPGFYTRDSGVKSPYNFETFEQAAQIIHAGRQLGLDSGYLMCIPPPVQVALDDTLISGIIEGATSKANNLGIRGKELTPFLLSEIARETQGASVTSNIQFVLNNARAGAHIASALSRLKNQGHPYSGLQPSQVLVKSKTQSGPDTNTTVVVGAVALDTQCSIDSRVRMNDSNPGRVESAIGGVGYNVALAAHWSNRYPTITTKLLTSVGNDLAASSILKDLKLPSDTIHIDQENPTAQYVSIHSKNGELVVACADMDIITKLPDAFLIKQLQTLKPNVVVVDANVSVGTLQQLVTLERELQFKLIFEPTSGSKARKLSLLKNLRPFPDNSFFLITPTRSELESIFTSFESEGKFDVDQWFPILDALQIDAAMRAKNAVAFEKGLFYAKQQGIFHMACNLLPYFPRIAVKDGANGLFVFTLKEDIGEQHNRESLANASFATKGLSLKGKSVGMMFEHYEVPLKSVCVKNVSGAGDTLLGVLSNEICHQGDIFNKTASIRRACMDRAQSGARLSVEDYGTVSIKLKELA
ncbi:LADA_0A08130g1_1 [Lachancea dasiensis]|uniref:LADA_0A08130g1_1 n=1 Tax=Lachancea dasiensis TaxID=1072105 RepID=A0A1G4IQP4_9SACH|nr:LADA_0A08130g1_1 [Lachancea dasiensis]